tara:strand:+ start:3908 stop:4423 length:516 start_codon:yes stop_codon:yes gene_type:complete
MGIHSLQILASTPLIRKVNIAVSQVADASIIGRIAVHSDGFRSSQQEGAVTVSCLNPEGLLESLRRNGCRVVNHVDHSKAILPATSPNAEALAPNEAVLVTFPNGTQMIGVGEEVEVEVDLNVLDLSISKLGEALATGDYDSQLDVLLAVERAGKTRKGAVAALKARMRNV